MVLRERGRDLPDHLPAARTPRHAFGVPGVSGLETSQAARRRAATRASAPNTAESAISHAASRAIVSHGELS